CSRPSRRSPRWCSSSCARGADPRAPGPPVSATPPPLRLDPPLSPRPAPLPVRLRRPGGGAPPPLLAASHLLPALPPALPPGLPQVAAHVGELGGDPENLRVALPGFVPAPLLGRHRRQRVVRVDPPRIDRHRRKVSRPRLLPAPLHAQGVGPVERLLLGEGLP